MNAENFEKQGIVFNNNKKETSLWNWITKIDKFKSFTIPKVNKAGTERRVRVHKKVLSMENSNPILHAYDNDKI